MNLLKNFNNDFNTKLIDLDSLLGKLTKTKSFTLQDLNSLESNLINLIAGLENVLTKIMQISQNLQKENNLFKN
jgi:hypothetical protein